MSRMSTPSICTLASLLYVTKPRSNQSLEPATEVQAAAMRPPVQLSAVAMRQPRERKASPSASTWGCSSFRSSTAAPTRR